MKDDKSIHSRKNLFNRLQEESWQLELLVSGFVILGLFYAIEPLEQASYIASSQGNGFMADLYMMAGVAVYILLFNLVLHLIFRGLWIGALGLRSVSNEIEIDQLNYHKKFSDYLSRRVGSFDDYIESLERFSSIIFAISFLLVFYFTSAVVIVKILTFLYAPLDGTFLGFAQRIVWFLLLVGSILTFIDFVTLGWLKKKKWLAKIYFPFYLVFSILTLSFLYRPLIYNFLDNKFGRLISILLLPIYISVYILSSIYYQKSNYITDKITNLSSSLIVNEFDYEDFVVRNKVYSNTFSIQSKVIRENYIKVKIPISKKLDDEIFEFTPDLKPEIETRGYKVDFINISYSHSIEDLREKFIKTFQQNYFFKIDSLVYKSDFVVAREKTEVWFETYIGIKDLPEGKHTLSFVKNKNKGSTDLEIIKSIPFWYYKRITT